MLHYVFFTRSTLPKPNAAYLMHDVQTANAVANLGYTAVLVYLESPMRSLNPIAWVAPFRPRPPRSVLMQFYGLHDRLRVSPLPMPWPIAEHRPKALHPSTWVCKYYLPMHLARRTGLVHTLDWNVVKGAIALGIPVIYEREHYPDHRYDPEIVQHPLFQVAVTVAQPIRDRMVHQGMPLKKIVQLPLGYNQRFVERSPQTEAWRQRLLPPNRRYLAVYAGGLYGFKGVDLLLDVAAAMPQVQFVLAGGDAIQVRSYRHRARSLANVEFLGHLTHHQLHPVLQAANAVLHPHCSGEAAAFTSPLKFFEYLASGTPIVATEIPPLMEFKSLPIPIWWCLPDSPSRFQQALQQTLERYPYIPDGYPTNPAILQRYSWEARLQKILDYVDPDILSRLIR